MKIQYIKDKFFKLFQNFQFEDVYDIHLAGSIITGFFDETLSDIDIFIIVENRKLWIKENKIQFMKFWKLARKNKFDCILLDKTLYLKYKNFIKSYSFFTDKVINGNKKIMPIIIPKYNEKNEDYYSIRIKQNKTDKWYEAYINNNMHFETETLKTRWLEVFNGLSEKKILI